MILLKFWSNQTSGWKWTCKASLSDNNHCVERRRRRKKTTQRSEEWNICSDLSLDFKIRTIRCACVRVQHIMSVLLKKKGPTRYRESSFSFFTAWWNSATFLMPPRRAYLRHGSNIGIHYLILIRFTRALSLLFLSSFVRVCVCVCVYKRLVSIAAFWSTKHLRQLLSGGGIGDGPPVSSGPGRRRQVRNDELALSLACQLRVPLSASAFSSSPFFFFFYLSRRDLSASGSCFFTPRAPETISRWAIRAQPNRFLSSRGVFRRGSFRRDVIFVGTCIAPGINV